MGRILRSSRAELDLVEIAEFIAQDNVSAALRFIESVEAAVTMLAEHPMSGRQYPLKPKPLQAVRAWVLGEFENYLLFYIPVEDGVHVLRIIDGRRAIPRLMEDM